MITLPKIGKIDVLKVGGVIAAIASAAHQVESDSEGAISFDDAVKALAATLTPQLPAKADGTAYTVDDVHAAAAAARAPWLRVLDKTSGAV